MSIQSVLVSGAELAELFNVSQRHIQNLANDEVVVRVERGKYELAGSVQGFVKHLQDKSVSFEDSGEIIDRRQEETRKVRAERIKIELQNSITQNEYRPVHELEQAMTKLCKILADNHRTLSANIKRALPETPAAVIHTVDTEVAKMQKEIRSAVFE